MPFLIDNAGKIKVFKIYFPYQEETNDAKLLLVPHCERLVVQSPGVAWLATLRECLGPLACQDALQAESLLLANREVGLARPSCQGSRFAV